MVDRHWGKITSRTKERNIKSGSVSCTENPIFEFIEMKLLSLVTNSYIYVSVSGIHKSEPDIYKHLYCIFTDPSFKV
jgi:hypothetical protein